MIPTQQIKFDRPAQERLGLFLSERQGSEKDILTALTPDASTREYFRVRWGNGRAVVAVYPEPIDPESHPFLDVTRLFRAVNLPVPAILCVESNLGIVVQEDLGDRQLRDALKDATKDESDQLREAAISLIAKIQGATGTAIKMDSIASRLAFDREKLLWELDFFFKHFMTGLRKLKFSSDDEASLRSELDEIATDLSNRPRVLCHRDYHVANLMVDQQNSIRIVDYQDARMGPASYDLVSLLLDRRTSLPSMAEIRIQRLLFLEERRLNGLPALDPDDFAREFRLMTVQRGLKAIGTFSNQTLCGRGDVYAQFINPGVAIVLQAMEWLDRFSSLRRTLKRCLEEAAPVAAA